MVARFFTKTKQDGIDTAKSLAAQMTLWAVALPNPAEEWSFVQGEFESLFLDRISTLINRPGDAMARQELETAYLAAVKAIQGMDQLCTAARVQSKGGRGIKARMAAAESISEVKKRIHDVAMALDYGFPCGKQEETE